MFLLFQRQVKASVVKEKTSTGYETADDKGEVQRPSLSAVISPTPSSLGTPHVCQNYATAVAKNSSFKMYMVPSLGEKQQVVCPESSRPDCGGSYGDETSKEKSGRARQHVCDVCHIAFTHVGNLRKHKWIHTGHKPFVCDICSKAFTGTSDVKRHKRMHTGHKPFPCDVCSKAFSQLYNLKGHKRIHTGDKPYCCDVCSEQLAGLVT